MKLDQKSTLGKLVLGGLLAALICLMTMVLMVPIPQMAGAYVNLGDVGVYLAAFLLGSPWGALAAALGSALADILLGSMLYAGPTFLIKGLMALFTALFLKHFQERRMLALALAGLVMPIGYFLFESILYGAQAALAGVLPNLMQYAGGVALGLPAIRIAQKMFHKTRMI